MAMAMQSYHDFHTENIHTYVYEAVVYLQRVDGKENISLHGGDKTLQSKVQLF